ncbi:BAG family molecular chaperone regulator 1-like, partial [Elysia marginata]
QKKLPMLVSLDGSDRPGDCLTVGHLSDAVTEVSQVKAEYQKLIHRGRTLFKNEPESMEAAFKTSLSSLAIKNGERIMLLGRKASGKQEEANRSEKKSPLNETIPPASDKLAELQARLDVISGRLEQEVAQASSLKTVDSTSAPENSGLDFRTQRKALVNSIQRKLDQCENCLSDVKAKIESLERQQEPSGGS